MSEKTDALDIIKEELGNKVNDKRTKAHKAVKEIEKKLDLSAEKINEWLDKIIDETITEFESV